MSEAAVALRLRNAQALGEDLERFLVIEGDSFREKLDVYPPVLLLENANDGFAYARDKNNWFRRSNRGIDQYQYEAVKAFSFAKAWMDTFPNQTRSNAYEDIVKLMRQKAHNEFLQSSRQGDIIYFPVTGVVLAAIGVYLLAHYVFNAV